MSKGPGKSQRLILQKVRELRAFYIGDLLPAEYEAKQYQTLYRAAMTLEKAGKIVIDRRWTGPVDHRSRHGRGNCSQKVLVHRVGTQIQHPMHFGESYKCIENGIVTSIKHLEPRYPHD